MMQSLALYGGTFDPIHLGHLNSANELQKRFAFDAFKLVPCHLPPHRQSFASPEQRKAMLELALQDFPALDMDCSELEKHSASYTVETLQYWREKIGSETPLVWVMGSDAFAGLSAWHQWQRLTDYAHLLVMQRAGQEQNQFEPEIENLLETSEARAENLLNSPAGNIAFVELEPWLVSASEVRQQLAEAHNCTVKNLLPEKVWQYIEQHHLYR